MGAPILFIPKKNRSLKLYIDYKDLNKITIKDRYSLLLINKILNQLIYTKIYIKFNIKNIYYYIQIKSTNK